MPTLVERFLRYLVTGGIAAIVDVGGFTLLLFAEMSLVPAATVSFCLAAIVNYTLTSRFVFECEATTQRFPAFFLGALIGLGINVLVTAVLAIMTPFNAVLAKVVGIGIAFLINFTINTKFVFYRATESD